MGGRIDYMKSKLLAILLLAAGSSFAASRFSIGFSYGSPGYYAAPVAVVRPAYPGPGYYWVDGYWGWNYGRRVWVPGYWVRRQHVERYDNRYYDDRYYNNRF